MMGQSSAATAQPICAVKFIFEKIFKEICPLLGIA
jgi:hypothetical protein